LPPSEGSGNASSAADDSVAAPSPLHDTSSRWAHTSSRLPTEFEFVDEERLFQADAIDAAAPIAVGEEVRGALPEGDSWVLQGGAPK
jgi:hypothetical protein